MPERAITGGINPYLFCDTCGHAGEAHCAITHRCLMPMSGNWKEGFVLCSCQCFVPEQQGRAEGIFQINRGGAGAKS